MTQEEKAKAYDEVLDRAKKWLNAPNVDKMPTYGSRVIKEIFPELKESEDERIRKDLIAIFKGQIPFTSEEDAKRYIAWLEKQDGIDNCPLESSTDTIMTDSKKNQVEPKFKADDWIVGANNVYKIVSLNNELNCYIAVTPNNEEVKIPYQFDDMRGHMCSYHLWTIQDAKDGDVLFHSDSASNGIFIFKEILDRGFAKEIICYCDYDSEDHFCLGEHHTCCWADAKILHPATLEQRDLLFQKMKEAGYMWNSESKQLLSLKTELCDKQNSTNLEEFINELSKQFPDVSFAKLSRIAVRVAKWAKPADKEMKELLRTEYEKGRADTIAEMKKPAWNGEDECYMSECIGAIATKDGWSFEEKRKTKHWLKSLKDRIGG